MGKYDFDRYIDRHGTNCKKTDLLQERFGRTDLLPLWIADMDFAVCPAITEALVKRLGGHPIYGYTPVYDSYWQSIIDWQRRHYGWEVKREELTYQSGGVTAFGMVINFFTRPGDRIVIQTPVYYDFKDTIDGGDRITVENPLRPTPDGFFEMDLEGLERIFAEEHPKMMVLCNPQNPIGIVWEPEVLREVARLARKYGVIVFSDEVFADLTLFGHRHTPMATVSDDARAVTITCGAPGKTFNIAGFKSTWLIITNEELRSPFYRWVEVNELQNSNIVALLATETAYRCGDEWLAECISYLEGNVDYVVNFCRERLPEIIAIKPQATYLLWLDCRGLGLDHDGVIDFFVNEAHLALNEGSMYGAPGRCHMRLNIATPRAVLEQAMKQLEAAVERRRH